MSESPLYIGVKEASSLVLKLLAQGGSRDRIAKREFGNEEVKIKTPDMNVGLQNQ